MRNGTGRMFAGLGPARGAGAARGLRRAGLAAAALALAAGPAAALMPPYVYENARRDAPSVIVIEVKAVKPPGGSGYGDCRVDGVVRAVERGTAFKPGDSVAIGVPCVGPDARPPLGGTIYQAVGTLSASKYGRAWLDAEGRVIFSQYEQLKALP